MSVGIPDQKCPGELDAFLFLRIPPDEVDAFLFLRIPDAENSTEACQLLEGHAVQLRSVHHEDLLVDPQAMVMMMMMMKMKMMGRTVQQVVDVMMMMKMMGRTVRWIVGRTYPRKPMVLHGSADCLLYQ